MKSRDLDDRQEQTQDCLSSRAPRSMTFVRCLKGRRRKKNQRINYRFVLPPPPPLRFRPSAFPFPFHPSFLPSFTGQEYLNTMPARRDRHRLFATTLLREGHVEGVKVNDKAEKFL